MFRLNGGIKQEEDLLYVIELLSQCVSFLAYPDSMIAKLGTEVFFDEQNRFERLNIDFAEDMLKSPPYSLSCYTESFMDLFAIGTFENHPAGIADSKLNMQVLRIHQFLQFCQKNLVLVCQHAYSPI